jgi:hypothetical protein
MSTKSWLVWRARGDMLAERIEQAIEKRIGESEEMQCQQY